MSKIRAANFEDTATGGISVPSKYLTQGSAKAYAYTDGGTTIAFLASFNFSSITDNGVGDGTANFTASMSSVSYNVSHAVNTGFAYSTNAAPRTMNAFALLATSLRVNGGAYISTGSVALDFVMHFAVLGTLA